MRGAHRPPRAAGKKQGARAPQPDPTLAQIREYFHLPVEEASERLGVNKSKLKRLCREYGVSRWPQRKLQSLSALRTHLQRDARLPAAELQALLIRLDQQVVQVLEDPDKPLDREFEDMRKNVYKVRYQKRKQQKLSSGSGAWVGDDDDEEEEGEARGGGEQGINKVDEEGTGDEDAEEHYPTAAPEVEGAVASRSARQAIRRQRRVGDVEASGASDDPALGSPEGATAGGPSGPAGSERVRRGHRVVQQPLAAPFRQRRRRRGFAGHRGRRGRRRLLTGRSRAGDEDGESDEDEGGEEEVSEGGGPASRDAGRSQVHSRSSSRNSNSESDGQGGGPSRGGGMADSGAKGGGSGQHHGRRGSAGSTAEGGPDSGRRMRLRMRSIGAIAGSRRRLTSAGESEGDQGLPLPTQLPRQQALLPGQGLLQQRSYRREDAAAEGPAQDLIDQAYGGDFARTGLPLHPHTPRAAVTDPPTAAGQRQGPASEPPPSTAAIFGPVMHGLPHRSVSSAYELGMPYGGSSAMHLGDGGASAGGVAGPTEWDAMMQDLLDGGGDGSQVRAAQGGGHEGLERHYSEPLGGTAGLQRAPAASLGLSPPGQQQSHSQPLSHPFQQHGLPSHPQRTHQHQQVPQQQSSSLADAAWGPSDESMRLAASYRSEPNTWLQPGTQERVQQQQSQQQQQHRMLLQLQQQSQQQRPQSSQWSQYPRPSSTSGHGPSRLAAQPLEEAQPQELQPLYFPYPYNTGPQPPPQGANLPLSPPPHHYPAGPRQERHRAPSWPSVAPQPPVPFVYRSSSGGSATVTTPAVVMAGRPDGKPPSNLASTALWHPPDDPNAPYQVLPLPQPGTPHMLRHVGLSTSAAALQPPVLPHPSQLLPTARPTVLPARQHNVDESRGPHAVSARAGGSSSASPQGGEGATARASHATTAAASAIEHMYSNSGGATAVGFPTGANPGPGPAVPQRRMGASGGLTAAGLDANVPAPTASASTSAAPRPGPTSGGVQLMDSRGAIAALSPSQTPYQVQQQQPPQSYYQPPPQGPTPQLALGLHPTQQQQPHSGIVMTRSTHPASVARTPGGGGFGGAMATAAASQYEPPLSGGPADTSGHPPASLQLLPYARSGQSASLSARPLRPQSQQQQDELARARAQARAEQRRQQLATYRLEDVLPPPPQQRISHGRSGPPYVHVPALPYRDPLWGSAGSGGLPAAPYGFIIPGRRAYSTSSDPRFTLPPGALGLMGPGGPTMGGRLQLSAPIHPIPLPPPHIQPPLLLPPPPPLPPPSHPQLPWEDLHRDMLERRQMQQPQLSARERALLGLGGLAPPRPQILRLENPPQSAHVPQSQWAYQQLPLPGSSARPPQPSPPRHRQLTPQSQESLQQQLQQQQLQQQQQQQHLEHLQQQRQQLQTQKQVSPLPEWKAVPAAAGSGSEDISLPRPDPPSSGAYSADPRGEDDGGAVWAYGGPEAPALLPYPSPYSGAAASTSTATVDPAAVRMEAPTGLPNLANPVGRPSEAMPPQLPGQERQQEPQQRERQRHSQTAGTFPAVAGPSASTLQLMPAGDGGDAAARGTGNPAITRFTTGASTAAPVAGDAGAQGSGAMLESQELPAPGTTADPDAVLRLMAQHLGGGGGGGGGFVSDEGADDAIADLLTRSPPGSPGDLLRQLDEGD